MQFPSIFSNTLGVGQKLVKSIYFWPSSPNGETWGDVELIIFTFMINLLKILLSFCTLRTKSKWFSPCRLCNTWKLLSRRTLPFFCVWISVSFSSIDWSVQVLTQNAISELNLPMKSFTRSKWPWRSERILTTDYSSKPFEQVTTSIYSQICLL